MTLNNDIVRIKVPGPAQERAWEDEAKNACPTCRRTDKVRPHNANYLNRTIELWCLRCNVKIRAYSL